MGMLTLIGVIGTWVQVIVGIVAISIEIHKNKQQKSNRPDQG